MMPGPRSHKPSMGIFIIPLIPFRCAMFTAAPSVPPMTKTGFSFTPTTFSDQEDLLFLKVRESETSFPSVHWHLRLLERQERKIMYMTTFPELWHPFCTKEVQLALAQPCLHLCLHPSGSCRTRFDKEIKETAGVGVQQYSA